MTGQRAMVLRLVTAIVSIAAVVSTVGWGYYYIFSRFSWYDDEGYVMMSVRQVGEGRALYDDVFSQYGPFYYVTRLALLTAFQLPVSHDVTRLITLATWVAIAVLIGLYLVRTTGSILASLVAYLMLFHHLRPLAHEPGHPQELALVLIAGLVALAALWNMPQRALALTVLAGMAVGALTLTKVNVGVYAALSMVLVIATFASTRFRTPLLLLVSLASTVLPWLVMRAHTASWAFGYAALVSLGTVAVALRCHGTSSERPFGLPAMSRFALAGTATAIATCLAIVARGTSAAGLLSGVLLQPLTFAATFSTEVRVASHAVIAALVSVVLALAYGLSRRRGPSGPTAAAWLFWWLKVAGGVVGVGLSLQSPHALLGAGPALLWLALIRPLGEAWTYDQLLPRVVLTTLASLQTLQAYPVAESQVAWATFLLIPVLVVSTADAVREFWATRCGPLPTVRSKTAVTLEAAALIGVLAVYAGTAGIVTARQRYESFSPLSLPGSLRVRLPLNESERYRWLVRHVRERCGAVVTLPGLNSIYFWTGLTPPTGSNTTAWPILLGRNDQQRIVDVLALQPDACAIEYQAGIRTGGRDETIMQLPLMRFVLDEFDVIDERDGYRFKVRRSAAAASLPAKAAGN